MLLHRKNNFNIVDPTGISLGKPCLNFYKLLCAIVNTDQFDICKLRKGILQNLRVIGLKNIAPLTFWQLTST